MSNTHQLVKWKPPVSEASRKVDEALARIRRCDVVQKVVAPERTRAGDVVDLPRICAVHDKPYVARYIAGRDGRFHHAQTFRVTQDLWEGQYQGNENVRPFPSGDLGDEGCPWCGAHSMGWTGPVNCTRCGAKVCFGRTAKNYFRCRPSCNEEGYLKACNVRQSGVVPVQRTGSGGTF